MSVRYQNINTALRKALNACPVVARSITVPKYYQGDTAPQAGPYLYAWLLTNPAEGVEMGAQEHERVTGVYQIDIYTPSAPEWASQDLVITDLLSSYFYRGRRLENCVKIERFAKGRTSNDGGYQKTVCEVYFSHYSPAG